MWEPTVVNLAHAYRKLKYGGFIINSFFNENLCAYEYSADDNFSAAITYYHKALWPKPDDQFCTEMLSLALVDEDRHGIDPKIEFECNLLFIPITV
ncbi:hypothetical protein WN943_014450 [Citrus x changshan-huyou]